MALKLMCITNQPAAAVYLEEVGTDWIFVDMEYINKENRAQRKNSVLNHHTIQDIRSLRKVITGAELLVRVNPIHEETAEYSSSEAEIEEVIGAGADIVMLPYFKTVQEVQRFLKAVNGRAKALLLLETPEAVELLDEILSLDGIDGIHIGLNDLSQGYRRAFMFEILSDGTVEKLCRKIRSKGIPYGFGGIGRPGNGLLPAEYIIREHYRLGSSYAILGQSFCRTTSLEELEQHKAAIRKGMEDIRRLEEECRAADADYFEKNRQEVVRRVAEICKQG